MQTVPKQVNLAYVQLTPDLTLHLYRLCDHGTVYAHAIEPTGREDTGPLYRIAPTLIRRHTGFLAHLRAHLQSHHPAVLEEVMDDCGQPTPAPKVSRPNLVLVKS